MKNLKLNLYYARDCIFARPTYRTRFTATHSYGEIKSFVRWCSHLRILEPRLQGYSRV